MDAVKHISPRAEQLLSEYGLGYIKAEYKGKLLKAGLISAVFFPVGLLILVFFLPTLLSPSFTTDGNWLEQLSNLFPTLLWGSCFLFMGIVGMIILVFVLWKGEQSIYFGDKGFIHSTWKIRPK